MDMDEHDEHEEEEEEEEAQPSMREPIYSTEGIHDKLEDIGWTSEAAWEETLMITTKTETQIDNVDDDLARELAFYNQALTATQEAIARFEKSGIPWLRPPDYYAEMVKTDDHMAKVKDQLMFEQKQIELAEERRKHREQKQYSKQVQAERIKQKTQEKKKQIDSISKLRKQREKSGFAGELDYDAEMKNMDRQARPQQRGKPQDRNMPARGAGQQVNKKRQAKDSKYGFGGSKRLTKQNDAVSAANMDGYKGPGKGGKPSWGGASAGGKKMGGKGGGKGAFKAKGGVKKPAQRPGKARRQAAKGGKK